MGNRTEPSSHYRHHDRGEETKQETTVNLNHQFISINASCALQQGIPAAVRLLRDQQEQTVWAGQLSALWFWNYMKSYNAGKFPVNEGYKLYHKVRLLRYANEAQVKENEVGY